MKPPCSEAGCDRPVLSRGLCSRCYQRYRNSGAWQKTYDGWQPVTATEPQPIVFGSELMPARFWRQVEMTDAGCWRWTGAKSKGYGVMNIANQARRLHLVTYEVFVGPRPRDLNADHLCHTNDPTCWLGEKCPHRACCHPLCVEFVTHAENIARGRMWRAKRTHCPAGHPYESPHAGVDSEGYQECRTCRYAKWRERYHRRKATKSD